MENIQIGRISLELGQSEEDSNTIIISLKEVDMEIKADIHSISIFKESVEESKRPFCEKTQTYPANKIERFWNPFYDSRYDIMDYQGDVTEGLWSITHDIQTNTYTLKRFELSPGFYNLIIKTSQTLSDGTIFENSNESTFQMAGELDWHDNYEYTPDFGKTVFREKDPEKLVEEELSERIEDINASLIKNGMQPLEENTVSNPIKLKGPQ